MLRLSIKKGVTEVKHCTWNEDIEKSMFTTQCVYKTEEQQYVETSGFKFSIVIDKFEEYIFNQEFKRDDDTYDADVILLQDILNLVLFLAPSEIITKKFICFLNTETVYTFLHSLVIYFEHFLKIVEFLLIRRDEISQNMPRVESDESINIKRIYSAHLTQYRLLLAREYSKILLGEGSMEKFHHYSRKLSKSKTITDRFFHESFLAFCIQVVWIAMHRRAYDIIEMEMGRLFRSEHFTLQVQDYIKYSEIERKVLYGKNYKNINYRSQISPIIEEITNVSKENSPILWIGKQKYRGTDLRIVELEMEFLVPSSQLLLINKTHGILGHPKKLYDTLLQLDWNEVRKRNFTEKYDPYNIVKQPRLQIPNINEEEIRKEAKEYASFFKITRFQQYWKKAMVDKWSQRDSIIDNFRKEDISTDIIVRCKKVLEEKEHTSNVEEIRKNFIERVTKLQKNY